MPERRARPLCIALAFLAGCGLSHTTLSVDDDALAPDVARDATDVPPVQADVPADVPRDVPIDTACVPACTGRTCGEDSCGGSCGACNGAQVCDPAGQCVCNPRCTGRACGDDGCGGSCGACMGATACNASGVCACVPNCGSRTCGSDGCGSSCGTCPDNQYCHGVVPTCMACANSADVRCGSSTCVDLTSSHNHCGACGNACGTHSTCNDSSCS